MLRPTPRAVCLPSRFAALSFPLEQDGAAVILPPPSDWMLRV